MSLCNDHEVEIEKRLHGALEPDRVAALEAHLADCATCRAFERGARKMEEAIRAMPVAAGGGPGWGRVAAELEKVVRKHRRRISYHMLLVALIAGTVIAIQRHAPLGSLMVFVLALLAGAAIAALPNWMTLRR